MDHLQQAVAVEEPVKQATPMEWTVMVDMVVMVYQVQSQDPLSQDVEVEQVARKAMIPPTVEAAMAAVDQVAEQITQQTERQTLEVVEEANVKKATLVIQVEQVVPVLLF
jgi:hypothetical protein